MIYGRPEAEGQDSRNLGGREGSPSGFIHGTEKSRGIRGTTGDRFRQFAQRDAFRRDREENNTARQEWRVKGVLGTERITDRTGNLALKLTHLRSVFFYYWIDSMPDGQLTMMVDGQEISIVKAPYFPQTPTDGFCYVCSLKMVLSYFKNEHPSRFIRDNTPDLSMDEIKKITRTREGGGTREQNLIKDLESSIPNLKFEIVREGSFDDIEESLNDNIPVIVLYSGDYLKNKEKGGGHAGVVIGITDDKIILNNPWFGCRYIVDKTEFLDAWDLEYRAYIKITPRLELQRTLGGVENGRQAG